MKYVTPLLAVITAFLLYAAPAATAYAQGNFDLSALRDGETILHINATEREKITQDLLVARLSYFAEGEDPKALQDEINRAVKKALDDAKSYDAVELSTEAYHVYRYDPPRHMQNKLNSNGLIKQEPIWRASQTIRLESTDSEALLSLAGKLQEGGLNMNELSYQLSSETREAVMDRLLTASLIKLQKRAGEAAKALGKSSANLVEVIANENGPFYPQPMMAMSARGEGMAQEMAAPQAAPGMTEVTLTVSARALLKP